MTKLLSILALAMSTFVAYQLATSHAWFTLALFLVAVVVIAGVRAK